jgi:hypothetical protein
MACISSSSPTTDGSYRAAMFDRSTAAGYGLDDGDPAPGQHKRRHPSGRPYAPPTLAIRTCRSPLQHATTKRHPSLRAQLTIDLSPCHNG